MNYLEKVNAVTERFVTKGIIDVYCIYFDRVDISESFIIEIIA